MLHLHNGQNILNKWHSEDTPSHQSFSESSLRDNLSQIHYQLSFRTSHLSTGNDDPMPQYELDDPDIHAFANLYSARRALDFLTAESLRIVRIGRVASLTNQSVHERGLIDDEVTMQRARLDNWAMKFDNILAGSVEGSTEDYVAMEELEIMHTSAIIWLEVGVSFEDTEADGTLATVVEQVEERHLKHCARGHESLSANFMFEDGVVPPICFVGTKNRQTDPRRNVALLVTTGTRDRGRAGSFGSGYGGAGSTVHEVVGLDGRRVLEIEVEPLTRKVDLMFVPGQQGQDDGTWQLKTDGS